MGSEMCIRDRGLTVLAPGCQLPEGKDAKAGIMLNRNGEEVSK